MFRLGIYRSVITLGGSEMFLYSLSTGSKIHLFQELNENWANEFNHENNEIVSVVGCDCGIVYPSWLAPLRRRVAFGDRWCVIQLGETAFVSSRLPCNSADRTVKEVDDEFLKIWMIFISCLIHGRRAKSIQ